MSERRFDAGSFVTRWSDRLIGLATNAATDYGAYSRNIVSGLWSGEDGRKDAAANVRRLFVRLILDWAQLWQTGSDLLKEIVNLPPIGTPESPIIESAIVRVAASRESSKVTISNLQHVYSEEVLKAEGCTLEPTLIDPKSGFAVIQIKFDSTNAAPGLYEGSLCFDSNPQDTVPVDVYVTKAFQI